MKTSPYIAYHEWDMKRSYQAASNTEGRIEFTAPFDFGDISAPNTMPAGSTYSYEYKPGICWDMPTAYSRGEA